VALPAAPAGRHRPGVRIGQRSPLVGGGVQNRLKAVERRHPLAQRCDPVPQSRGLGLRSSLWMKRCIENLEANHTNIMSEIAFSHGLDPLRRVK
jgi:hypothetical protein